MKINVGCGTEKLSGYINVDPFVSGADFNWSACQLQIDDATVDEICAFHVIEHMTRDDARKAICHWFIKLEHGGKVIVECPDLRQVCIDYLNGKPEGITGIFGNQLHAGQIHAWGYVLDTLCDLLESAGFKIVYKGSGQDGHAIDWPCIRVEGIKP